MDPQHERRKSQDFWSTAACRRCFHAEACFGMPARRASLGTRAGASSRTPKVSSLAFSYVELRIAGRGSRVYRRWANMDHWPHAPAHCLTMGGTYIVTAGTYRKLPIFNSPKRLSLLCRALFDRCVAEGWELQAWSAFPNHYHFVASSPSPQSLRRLIRAVHSITAHEVNELDRQPGRRVWYQYWDSLVPSQRSYFARLRYVHENAVRHGVVRRAANYPWCSAGWFERKAQPALRRTVLGFPCDKVRVPDSFDVGFNI